MLKILCACLLLCSCASERKQEAPVRPGLNLLAPTEVPDLGLILGDPISGITIDSAYPPRLNFDITYIEDWSEEGHWHDRGMLHLRNATAKDAKEYGIPDDLFLWCLEHRNLTPVFQVTLPKPCKL